MSVPLYDTDVQKITDRTAKTTLADTDVLVVADSSGTLAPITKVNTKETLGINANATAITTLNGDVSTAGSVLKVVKDNAQNATYDPSTSGLTATTVKTAIDELADEKAEQTDLETLETTVDTNRLYSDSQYLALKAKADSLQVKCNTLQAEVYTDDPILQYGAVEIIGKGYEADNTPIDVSVNVVDGKLDMEQKGLTITNLVENGDCAIDSNSDGLADNWSLGSNATSPYVSSNAQYWNALDSSAYSSSVRVKIPSVPFKIGDVLALIYDNREGGGTAIWLSNMTVGTAITVGTRINSANIDIKRVTMSVNDTVIGVVFYGSSGLNGVGNVRLINLTALGLDHITDTDILAQLLPYVDGTKSVGKMGIQILDADDNVTQTIFLPEVGNRVPNGVSDSIKTVADGWEHTKRVERYVLQESDVIGMNSKTTQRVRLDRSNFTGVVNGKSPGHGVSGQITIGGFTESRWNGDNPATSAIGTWSYYGYPINDDPYLVFTLGTYASLAEAQADLAGTVIYYQLATPITTHYDLPHLTSGKTIHRFAGEEKIALYGTGLTFSESVLSVLSAVKFVAGVMTDITSLATITGATVTFSGVNATDVVYVKVEHDVDRPLGILEHTPAVSNTASRLTAIEAWIAAQEEA